MIDPKSVEVVKAAWPDLPPAEADSVLNYIMEVLDFLRKWCVARAAAPPSGSCYACFIGLERIAQFDANAAGFAKRSILFEDTPQDLLGNIFISALTLHAVSQKTAALSSFEDCKKECASFEAPGHPVIWFNAAESVAMWSYISEGSREWFRCSFVLSASNQAATLTSPTQIDKALIDFHNEHTHLPNGLADPWASAKDRLTRDFLENRLRDHLYIFMRHLRGGRMIRVMRELHCTVGRCDVVVLFPEEDTQVFLELKVLRSRNRVSFEVSKKGWVARNAADEIAWAEKGVQQVYEYRKSQNAVGMAYSCCYDGRDDNQDIPSAVALAAKLDVQHRRYYMFSSAESYYASINVQASPSSP